MEQIIEKETRESGTVSSQAEVPFSSEKRGEQEQQNEQPADILRDRRRRVSMSVEAQILQALVEALEEKELVLVRNQVLQLTS